MQTTSSHEVPTVEAHEVPAGRDPPETSSLTVHGASGRVEALNALADEPDRKGQHRSGMLGLLLALAFGGVLVLISDRVVPTRRLLSQVLPIEMVSDRMPPKQLELPPPPVLPLPELPRPQPKRIVTSSETPATPPPAALLREPGQHEAESVGLDVTSFGSGGGGPAFQVGTTQMGTPGQRATFVPPAAPVAAPPAGAREGVLVEARARPDNPRPQYGEDVRKRNVQGLMVVETDIDTRGRVTRAVVRAELDPELDAATVRTLERWTFEPATLEGKPVSSTKFLRFRFQLE